MFCAFYHACFRAKKLSENALFAFALLELQWNVSILWRVHSMATTSTKRKRKTKPKPKIKPLPTLWQIPDALWERIEPILFEFWPKKPTGRKVADWRKMLNAIIFRMR